MKAQMHNYSTWVNATEPYQLREHYINKLKSCGFEILNISEHTFQPHGYTLLVLLSESHFALHTFPEHNQTYIELSSCVKRPFDKFTSKLP